VSGGWGRIAQRLGELFTAPRWSREVPQTPLGVSGLIPADSSSSLGFGVVVTHNFTARRVDDRIGVSLRLSGVADDLILLHVVCWTPLPAGSGSQRCDVVVNQILQISPAGSHAARSRARASAATKASSVSELGCEHAKMSVPDIFFDALVVPLGPQPVRSSRASLSHAARKKCAALSLQIVDRIRRASLPFSSLGVCALGRYSLAPWPRSAWSGSFCFGHAMISRAGVTGS